jgi:DNA-binding MarR family transcriptional regulator
VAPCIDLVDPFQDLKHRSLKSVRRNSGFSASEATRLIKSLKSAKYLQTSPRAGDRRFLQLEVTPLGRKIIWRSFRAFMADFGQFKQFEKQEVPVHLLNRSVIRPAILALR